MLGLTLLGLLVTSSVCASRTSLSRASRSARSVWFLPPDPAHLRQRPGNSWTLSTKSWEVVDPSRCMLHPRIDCGKAPPSPPSTHHAPATYHPTKNHRSHIAQIPIAPGPLRKHCSSQRKFEVRLTWSQQSVTSRPWLWPWPRLRDQRRPTTRTSGALKLPGHSIKNSFYTCPPQQSENIPNTGDVANKRSLPAPWSPTLP